MSFSFVLSSSDDDDDADIDAASTPQFPSTYVLPSSYSPSAALDDDSVSLSLVSDSSVRSLAAASNQRFESAIAEIKSHPIARTRQHTDSPPVPLSSSVVPRSSPLSPVITYYLRSFSLFHSRFSAPFLSYLSSVPSVYLSLAESLSSAFFSPSVEFSSLARLWSAASFSEANERFKPLFLYLLNEPRLFVCASELILVSMLDLVRADPSSANSSIPDACDRLWPDCLIDRAKLDSRVNALRAHNPRDPASSLPFSSFSAVIPFTLPEPSDFPVLLTSLPVGLFASLQYLLCSLLHLLQIEFLKDFFTSNSIPFEFASPSAASLAESFEAAESAAARSAFQRNLDFYRTDATKKKKYQSKEMKTSDPAPSASSSSGSGFSSVSVSILPPASNRSFDPSAISAYEQALFIDAFTRLSNARAGVSSSFDRFDYLQYCAAAVVAFECVDEAALQTALELMLEATPGQLIIATPPETLAVIESAADKKDWPSSMGVILVARLAQELMQLRQKLIEAQTKLSEAKQQNQSEQKQTDKKKKKKKKNKKKSNLNKPAELKEYHIA